MKKKTIKALKKLSKLSPAEKVAATVVGAAIFPVALTLGTYKQWKKKKRRRKRKLF